MMSKRLKWLLLTAITLLAAFLRLYRIDALPPGDMYDPAFYGLDALEILRGETPIYFTSNYGREPLFSYLVAACVALLGVGSMAIYVASALIGILTVPAVYLAAEALLVEEEGWPAEFGGLVAALATALSFWHLMWSRSGVRAILTPLFAALAVWALWRGLRGPRNPRGLRWLPFVGCGVLLGLGMYTYQASYLLPVLVVAGWAFANWRRRTWTRRAFMQLAAVALIALLIFAPLALYYLTHRDASLERVREANVFQETYVLGAVLGRLKATALAFGIRGDVQPRINLPGRPALNPFFFGALLLGAALSLWRIKRPAFFTLLAWLGLMCLPSILGLYSELEKRILGSLPAVMILIAVGLLAPLEALWRWTQARVRGQYAATVGAVMVCLALVAGFSYSGVRTYRDYFDQWGQDPALFTHFGVGFRAIGQYAANLPPENRIYVSPVSVEHPSLVYNAGGRPGMKSYHGNHCLVLPERAEGGVIYIVVPSEDKQSVGRLQAALPQGALQADGPLHYGEPYFVSYHVPPGAQPQIAPQRALDGNWAGQIGLLGYDLDAGEGRIAVRLYLYALAKMETDYTVSVQLIGPENPATGGPLWSQDDSEPCRRYRPTSTWTTDEITIDDYALALPADRIPGEPYTLIVGFYDWTTMERLALLDAAGQTISDHLVLEELVFDPG